MVILCFLRNCQTCFHSGSTILPAVYKCSAFSTSLPIFFFFFFHYNHPNVCEVLSHCSFDFHFPYDKWCWASFHVPVDHLYISCGGISIQILCPLFLKNYFFFFAMLRGLWDLSLPTRDWTWATAVKALSPNHLTPREFTKIVISLRYSCNSL